MSAELNDRFNAGYRAAEAHWRKRWYAANADHQAAVTENEHLRADLIRVNAEYHGLLSDVEAERDELAARLAAVEALAKGWAVMAGQAMDADTREWLTAASRSVCATLAAPTDTTKEQS